jgi:antitoxin CptB
MMQTFEKNVAETNMADTEKRRLSWRCRRGLLELDIVLQRFAEQYLANLTSAELNAFDTLLDYPDNLFLDVVTQRKAVDLKHNSIAMQSLLQKLSA